MTKNIPHHIGIIIDGNRRWARERRLPTLVGHTKGIANIKKIVVYAQKLGIKILTSYAFSTENWKRPKKEVNYLMKLFEKFIDKNIQEFHQKGIRLRHLGQARGLPPSLQKKIKQAIDLTKKNQKMIFQVALNYGGRDEIKRTIQKIINKRVKLKKITDDLIAKNLDTTGLPDPDLIIRTSGEQRLSGFLLWQSAYAELYFPKIYWPDFNEKELDKAILDYCQRQRRHGQ
jgi:undecaprenyl diphosphate synthase